MDLGLGNNRKKKSEVEAINGGNKNSLNYSIFELITCFIVMLF